MGARTLVMGILNVTPDSFADGGRFFEPREAVEAGVAMVEAGADIIDIGGESTRPGAAAIDGEEECRRVLPVVEALAKRVDVPLSVDTYRASTAAAAVERGAVMLNDISGLIYDPELAVVASATGAGLVLVHTRGRSADMYARAAYADVAVEVAAELRAGVQRAREAGLSPEAIIIDPGIGFAKRAEHSFEVLARLSDPAILALDRPLLVGPSRKSFLTLATGDRSPVEREWATAAAVTAAVLGGAHIVRVHGVAAMVQAVRVADAIRARQS